MDLTTTVSQARFVKEGCQYIGSEQDPRIHMVKMCGCKVVPKAAYCEEHMAVIYQNGKRTAKKASAAPVVKKQHEWAPGELEDLMWEVYQELLIEGEIVE